MSPRLLVVSLLLFVTLTGCKIRLSTTEGGSIESVSGTYSCSPGASCADIDVGDKFFDETFQAVPDAGFEFVGWRRQDRGLCGGSTEDCRVSFYGAAFAPPSASDSLSQFDRLLNLTAARREEIFFLEAVFAEAGSVDTGGGGTGSGSATQCWDEDLGSPGTTIVASFKSRTAQGGVLDFSYDQTIEGGATFNGQSALLATSNTTATGDAASTSITKSYYQLPGNQRVNNLGIETTLVTPVSGEVVATIDPLELERFDLNAGDSFSQSYTIDTATTTTALGQSFTSNVSASISQTTTFEGIESVTVPAGTYDACKFTRNATTNGATDEVVTEWYAVGSGFLLKNTAGDTTTELISASVNGVDI